MIVLVKTMLVVSSSDHSHPRPGRLDLVFAHRFGSGGVGQILAYIACTPTPSSRHVHSITYNIHKVYTYIHVQHTTCTSNGYKAIYLRPLAYCLALPAAASRPFSLIIRHEILLVQTAPPDRTQASWNNVILHAFRCPLQTSALREQAKRKYCEPEIVT